MAPSETSSANRDRSFFPLLILLGHYQPSAACINSTTGFMSTMSTLTQLAAAED